MNDPFQRKRLLILEDELLVARDLAQFAEQADWEVAAILPNVSAALTLLSKEKISAALVDYRLRDGTAEPVIAELKRQRLPFAVITAHNIAEYILNTGKGRAYVVSKPYGPATIRNLLTYLDLLSDGDETPCGAQSLAAGIERISH